MASDPILHLLGLAKKAGRLELGEEPVGAVCRARQARLVLLASDAAPNTARRAAHFGQAGNVLWLELPFTKAELGDRFSRSSCAMLALTDAGFAAAVAEKLAARDPERYGPAAQQLREKADKVLQRQREQRRHEKNLREGKKHPWAPPPAQLKQEAGAQAPKKRGAARAPQSHQPQEQTAPHKGGPRAPRPGGGRPAGRKAPGPGARKLTGKFPNPKK